MNEDERTLDADPETLEQIQAWASEARAAAQASSSVDEGTMAVDQDALDELVRFAEQAKRSSGGEGAPQEAELVDPPTSQPEPPAPVSGEAPILKRPVVPDTDDGERPRDGDVTLSSPDASTEPTAPRTLKAPVVTGPPDRPVVEAQRSHRAWQPPERIVVPKTAEPTDSDVTPPGQRRLVAALTALCAALAALVLYLIVFTGDEAPSDPTEVPASEDQGGGL